MLMLLNIQFKRDYLDLQNAVLLFKINNLKWSRLYNTFAFHAVLAKSSLYNVNVKLIKIIV